MNLGVDLFWPAWAAGAFALAALFAHIYAYRTTSKPVSNPMRWLLLEIRLAALALIIFALWRPAAETQTTLSREMRLALMVDASRSMSVGDERNGPDDASMSRLARAAAVFADNSVLWGRIAEDYETGVYTFSKGLEALPTTREKLAKTPLSGASANGEVTALGDALREVMRMASAPEAVLLISDGLSNTGIDPLDAVVAGAAPVYAISVGRSEASQSTRDAAVAAVYAPGEAFVGSEISVVANVSIAGLEGRPLDITFSADGAAVETRRISTDRRQAVEDVTFAYVPEKAGPARLEIRVEPVADEIVATNNKAATYVDVREGRMKILYLEGTFRWEAKFLRSAVESAKDVDLRLLVAADKAAVARALAQEWDVLIIGDLPAADIPAAAHGGIVDAVSEKGKGVCFLGGNRGLGRGGYGSTALAPLVPFELSPGESFDRLPYRPKAGAPSPFSALAELGEPGADIWNVLAPLSPTNLVGPARAGASVVLAGEPVARDEKSGAVVADLSRSATPLFAVQEFGKGRAAAVAADGTWQWVTGAGIEGAERRDAAAEAHRRFWRQLAFWLARREQRGQITVNLTLPRHRADIGEKVEMEAKVLDADLEPLTDAILSAKIASTGPPAEKRFWLEGDDYKVDFEPPAPGDYIVTVTASKGGVELATAESAFVVAGTDIEFLTLVSRPSLLEALARATGGMYAPASGAAEVLAAIQKRAAGAEYQALERRELWSSWWYLAAVLALLALEWALRKASGLV